MFHATAQLLNKFTIAQILMSESVTSVVRREFRRLFPDLKFEAEIIQDIVVNEILKREVIEGEKVKDAQTRLKKAAQKLAKATRKADEANVQNAKVDLEQE
jgi:hypothetical protein